MFTIKIVNRIQDHTIVMCIIKWNHISGLVIIGNLYSMMQHSGKWHTQMERKTVVIRVKSVILQYPHGVYTLVTSIRNAKTTDGKIFIYTNCSITDHNLLRRNMVWRSLLPPHFDSETPCFKSLSRSNPWKFYVQSHRVDHEVN